MDLQKLSLNELKVMFYDEQVKLEVAQNNMRVISQEIANRPVEEPVKEKK